MRKERNPLQEGMWRTSGVAMRYEFGTAKLFRLYNVFFPKVVYVVAYGCHTRILVGF
jgi:hypothetical protein